MARSVNRCPKLWLSIGESGFPVMPPSIQPYNLNLGSGGFGVSTTFFTSLPSGTGGGLAATVWPYARVLVNSPQKASPITAPTMSRFSTLMKLFIQRPCARLVCRTRAGGWLRFTCSLRTTCGIKRNACQLTANNYSKLIDRRNYPILEGKRAVALSKTVTARLMQSPIRKPVGYKQGSAYAREGTRTGFAFFLLLPRKWNAP